MGESIKASDFNLDPLFKPADIIIFSGLKKIDAILVRLFTVSEYSHTTIILDSNLEGYPNAKVAIFVLPPTYKLSPSCNAQI